MSGSLKVTLYTTLGCHLCEQAEAMLHHLVASGRDITIESVDIADSDELMDLYGIRIPVITTPERSDDIGWPFTLEELDSFLST